MLEVVVQDDRRVEKRRPKAAEQRRRCRPGRASRSMPRTPAWRRARLWIWSEPVSDLPSLMSAGCPTSAPERRRERKRPGRRAPRGPRRCRGRDDQVTPRGVARALQPRPGARGQGGPHVFLSFRSLNLAALFPAGMEALMSALKMVVNGTERRVEAPPEESLLSVLRNRLGLTGTKYGCGEGQCGACTVLLDGRPRAPAARRSLSGGQQDHDRGGPGAKDGLHPVQAAFLEVEAFQCGFCTPGMIVSAVGLLEANGNPSDEEIAGRLAGNVCRCGTYPRILAAVRQAARGDGEGVSAKGPGQDFGRISSSPSTRSAEAALVPGRPARLPEDPRRRPARLPVGRARSAQESGRGRGGGPELPPRRLGLAPHRRGRQSSRSSPARSRWDRTSAPRSRSTWPRSCGRRRVHPDGDGRYGPDPWDAGTFGSRSTPTMGPQLRAAAAAAREELLDLAAEKWKADRAELAPRPERSRTPRRVRRSATAS